MVLSILMESRLTPGFLSAEDLKDFHQDVLKIASADYERNSVLVNKGN